MKHFPLRCLCWALLLLSLPVAAQERLERAFTDFASRVKTQKTEYKDRIQGRMYGSRSYRFRLPAAKGTALQSLEAAFAADEAQAYRVIRLTDGDGKTVSHVVGPRGESIAIGKDYDNATLMCFAAPSDSTWRTVYAIEWSERNDSLTGRLIAVEGKRPEESKAGPARLSAIVKGGKIHLDPKIFGDSVIEFDSAEFEEGMEEFKQGMEELGRGMEGLKKGLSSTSKSGKWQDIQSNVWKGTFSDLLESAEEALQEDDPKADYLVSALRTLAQLPSYFSEPERKKAVKDLNRLLKAAKSKRHRKVLEEAIKHLQ